MFVLSVCMCLFVLLFFFFKQKTAYEMRISDWSSDVCSSDLLAGEQVVDPEISGIGAARKLGQVQPEMEKRPQRRVGEAVVIFLVEIGRASCRERVCQYV